MLRSPEPVISIVLPLSARAISGLSTPPLPARYTKVAAPLLAGTGCGRLPRHRTARLHKNNLMLFVFIAFAPDLAIKWSVNFVRLRISPLALKTVVFVHLESQVCQLTRRIYHN